MLGASLIASTLVSIPAHAQANKVKISGLSDVSYGTIANLQVDSRRSQDICVTASGNDGLYTVTASGTGSGNSLVLTNGAASLPFSVEWSASPGQSGGSNLSSGAALLNQYTPEKQQDCKARGLDTASVTVILRGAALSMAQEGNYSGTLTLLISAQ